METLRRIMIIPLLVISCVWSTPLVLAEKIELSIASFEDGGHRYYHDLLSESLKSLGQEAVIKDAGAMPQKRIVKMLDDDQISLHWLVQSPERDQMYTPVEVGLTNGLIGKRILFIPQGTQASYDTVNNLEDFRQLGKVGGFGKGWFDVKVWQANQLKFFEEDGDWKKIYKKLEKGDRGIDYFSRGMNEILGEFKENSFLAIEQRLVLVYERDFRFYLSKSAAKHKMILEEALKKAKESGLIDQLIRKHWADAFQQLNFDKRLQIKLELPQ